MGAGIAASPHCPSYRRRRVAWRLPLGGSGRGRSEPRAVPRWVGSALARGPSPSGSRTRHRARPRTLPATGRRGRQTGLRVVPAGGRSLRAGSVGSGLGASPSTFASASDRSELRSSTFGLGPKRTPILHLSASGPKQASVPSAFRPGPGRTPIFRREWRPGGSPDLHPLGLASGASSSGSAWRCSDRSKPRSSVAGSSRPKPAFACRAGSGASPASVRFGPFRSKLRSGPIRLCFCGASPASARAAAAPSAEASGHCWSASRNPAWHPLALMLARLLPPSCLRQALVPFEGKKLLLSAASGRGQGRFRPVFPPVHESEAVMESDSLQADSACG